MGQIFTRRPLAVGSVGVLYTDGRIDVAASAAPPGLPRAGSVARQTAALSKASFGPPCSPPLLGTALRLVPPPRTPRGGGRQPVHCDHRRPVERGEACTASLATTAGSRPRDLARNGIGRRCGRPNPLLQSLGREAHRLPTRGTARPGVVDPLCTGRERSTGHPRRYPTVRLLGAGVAWNHDRHQGR